MKTIQHFKLMVAMVMVAALAFVTSCGSDDDEAPKPTASFSYENTGREVTFSNSSKNATSYAWDFGDGQSSTEQNPVHTYDAYGKYTVKLKVTGDGGEASSLPDEITLAKDSDVDIDGVFTEWSSIDAASTFASEGNEDLSSMSELKVDYDASNIYFYVKGTSAMKAFFDVFINADNDTLSGYASGTYRAYGAEYLYEGDLGADVDAGLLKFDGPTQADFSYGVTAAEPGSGFLATSGVVTLGDGSKAIEFSISRAVFPDLSDEKIGVAVMDWKDPGNNEWYYIGSLPGAYKANRLYYLDLTK